MLAGQQRWLFVAGLILSSCILHIPVEAKNTTFSLASVSTVLIQLHLRSVSKCTDWVVSAAYRVHAVHVYMHLLC